MPLGAVVREPSRAVGCAAFAVNAEAVRVWFTVLAHDLDPLLAPMAPTGTVVGDAVDAIAVAVGAQPEVSGID